MIRTNPGQCLSKMRPLILANCRFITTAIDNSPNNTNSETVISEKQPDEFTKEFLGNRIKLSTFQKVLLSAGSSLTALFDPHRHDMIACLGETTGDEALNYILEQMRDNDEGRKILSDKPRINTKTVNIETLRNLPKNTFGYGYVQFLDDNNVTPDSRMVVKFLEDPDLAYVMTRYRECHDLLHTVLGMPTNMLGEVAVKWVEAINTKLPMCYGGAIFGAARLRPKQRRDYKSKYLPWAIANGKSAKPLMSIYWEQRWEQDMTELRKELGIQILK